MCEDGHLHQASPFDDVTEYCAELMATFFGVLEIHDSLRMIFRSTKRIVTAVPRARPTEIVFTQECTQTNP